MRWVFLTPCNATYSCLAQQKYGKKLLTNIIKNVPLIVKLLKVYGPTPESASPRAAKRVKITEYEHQYLFHSFSELSSGLRRVMIPYLN